MCVRERARANISCCHALRTTKGVSESGSGMRTVKSHYICGLQVMLKCWRELHTCKPTALHENSAVLLKVVFRSIKTRKKMSHTHLQVITLVDVGVNVFNHIYPCHLPFS